MPGRALVLVTLVIAVLIGALATTSRAGVSPLITAPNRSADHLIEEAPVDLSGNEVRHAVAKYKVDPTGALYEEHSPETEVPKLAPPKS